MEVGSRRDWKKRMDAWQCGIKRQIRVEVRRAGRYPEAEGGERGEIHSSSVSLHVDVVWRLFKINLRLYHCARAPSLEFYNFIILLQWLYQLGTLVHLCSTTRWIINRGRERRDNERHERRVALQPQTFSSGVVLNLSCGFLLSFTLAVEVFQHHPPPLCQILLLYGWLTDAGAGLHPLVLAWCSRLPCSLMCTGRAPHLHPQAPRSHWRRERMVGLI